VVTAFGIGLLLDKPPDDPDDPGGDPDGSQVKPDPQWKLADKPIGNRVYLQLVFDLGGRRSFADRGAQALGCRRRQRQRWGAS
jgi:hypothetical protein